MTLLLTNKIRLGPNPATAQQVTVISGLGTLEFGKAVMAIINIHSQFCEHSKGSAFQAHLLRKDRGYPVLKFCNRYLTLEDEADQEDNGPLPADIDPLDILHKSVPNGRYTAENEVQYYERQEQKDGLVSCIL